MHVLIDNVEYFPKQRQVNPEVLGSPYKTLGDLLLSCREALGMERSEVARELSLHPQNLLTWEKNHCLPSLTHAAELCRFYGIPPEVMLELAMKD